MHIFFNNKNFSTLHKLKVVAITFCHFVEKKTSIMIWYYGLTISPKRKLKVGFFMSQSGITKEPILISSAEIDL